MVLIYGAKISPGVDTLESSLSTPGLHKSNLHVIICDPSPMNMTEILVPATFSGFYTEILLKLSNKTTISEVNILLQY
jgi:hypothetical protein